MEDDESNLELSKETLKAIKEGREDIRKLRVISSKDIEKIIE